MYIDIDGQLVWSLSSIIHPDTEVVITRRDKYTNFFLASEKGNPFLKRTLDIIVDNDDKNALTAVFFIGTCEH